MVRLGYTCHGGGEEGSGHMGYAWMGLRGRSFCGVFVSGKLSFDGGRHSGK